MHSRPVRKIAEHNGQSSRGTVFPAVAMEEDAPTILPGKSHISHEFLDPPIEVLVLNWELYEIGLATLSVQGVLRGIRHLVDTRRGVMPRSLDDDPHLVPLNYVGVARDLPAAEKNRINPDVDARRVAITDFEAE